MNSNNLFKTSIEFSQYIEETAFKNKQTVLETLINFMDEYGAEPEEFKKLISNSLKDQLAEDFKLIGKLKQNATLNDFVW